MFYFILFFAIKYLKIQDANTHQEQSLAYIHFPIYVNIKLKFPIYVIYGHILYINTYFDMYTFIHVLPICIYTK